MRLRGSTATRVHDVDTCILTVTESESDIEVNSIGSKRKWGKMTAKSQKKLVDDSVTEPESATEANSIGRKCKWGTP